jgi:hypothetical protein
MFFATRCVESKFLRLEFVDNGRTGSSGGVIRLRGGSDASGGGVEIDGSGVFSDGVPPEGSSPESDGGGDVLEDWRAMFKSRHGGDLPSYLTRFFSPSGEHN